MTLQAALLLFDGQQQHTLWLVPWLNHNNFHTYIAIGGGGGGEGVKHILFHVIQTDLKQESGFLHLEDPRTKDFLPRENTTFYSPDIKVHRVPTLFLYFNSAAPSLFSSLFLLNRPAKGGAHNHILWGTNPVCICSACSETQLSPSVDLHRR